MADKKTPAPIDRPLSRAYLREFTGWSTEFPPGLSDPTSLRLMENVMINRDGSARVRPGLRFLSYDTLPTDTDPGTAFPLPLVGTHEVFFMNDGRKAYLFAVRETDGSVGFRVLRFASGTEVLTLADAGFDVPQTEAVLNFGSSTTYVKYVQIDNKIFAMSNAGETVRLFEVGSTKSAKRLSSVEKPDWDPEDKLTVVHPESLWIAGGTPVGTRVNIFRNPMYRLPPTVGSKTTRTEVTHLLGGNAPNSTSAAEITNTPLRTNYAGDPLDKLPSTPPSGWWIAGARVWSISVVGDSLRMQVSTGDVNRNSYLNLAEYMDVTPGESYYIAYDGTAASSNVQNFRVAVDFYSASGAKVGDTRRGYGPDKYFGRHVFGPFTVPTNAVKMRPQPYANIDNKSTAWWQIKDVAIVKVGESTAVFSGDDGPDYAWAGTPRKSPSLYYPPFTAQAELDRGAVVAGSTYSFSGVAWTDASGPNVRLRIEWKTSSGGSAGSSQSALTALTGGAATTLKIENVAAPAGAVEAVMSIVIINFAQGIKISTWGNMGELGATVGSYFDGTTASTPPYMYSWDGTPDASSSREVEYAAPLAAPSPATPTDKTLVSDGSVGNENDYSFGLFYSFNNEVGESAASQVTVLKAQRPWSQWLWETPNTASEPSGTPTANAAEAADQLVAIMPEDVYDQARTQGALSWNLYLLSWSDQEVVPTTAIKIGTKELSASSDYGLDGWMRITSQSAALSTESAPMPTLNSRYNYSNPSRAGQGLVASDRMVLVYDPVDAAVIRWSSNLQGDYTNFTANKGGGYKTLTSGNLYVPACVKLWQNPQSVDTLTVLCMGVDGYSTGYYMAPAQIAQQSEATNVMGFEETTATPGTTSPYGCEVLNNALYHPLDEQLMKSTATNYNINHKSMTDQIQRMWNQLASKEKMISSQLDNRLYYIVNNPSGAPVPAGQNGNEIWVLDTAAENGHWSRWLVQAHSLRKIEFGGQVYMSVVSVDGIYFFDPSYSVDEYVSDTGEILERNIPWLLETNTQGANRAHDAWCHLRQLELAVGNFVGTMRYGIRTWDLNGKALTFEKIVRNLEDVDIEQELPFDLLDQLRVAREVKEWFFFAESVTDENGELLHSSGQLDTVQYRYTPVSVNVGYDYGSVETFEYARATANWAERTTDNGVPIPVNDQRRP